MVVPDVESVELPEVVAEVDADVERDDDPVLVAVVLSLVSTVDRLVGQHRISAAPAHLPVRVAPQRASSPPGPHNVERRSCCDEGSFGDIDGHGDPLQGLG